MEDDGFNRDPDALVAHALKNAKKGDPEDFLRVIDEFCWKNGPYMNLGDEKGLILDQIFKESDPAVAVELGSFIGYSAVRMARLMKTGGRIYAIEIDPIRAKTVRQVADFAGVGDKVTIVNESAERAIPSLKEIHEIEKMDFVFIDHEKEFYKPDLIRIIDAGLLDKGSVVVADNVVFHGLTEYLEFVRNHPKFTSEHFESTLEYTPEVKDGLEKSVYVG